MLFLLGLYVTRTTFATWLIKRKAAMESFSWAYSPDKVYPFVSGQYTSRQVVINDTFKLQQDFAYFQYP